MGNVVFLIAHIFYKKCLIVILKLGYKSLFKFVLDVGGVRSLRWLPHR